MDCSVNDSGYTYVGHNTRPGNVGGKVSEEECSTYIPSPESCVPPQGQLLSSRRASVHLSLPDGDTEPMDCSTTMNSSRLALDEKILTVINNKKEYYTNEFFFWACELKKEDLFTEFALDFRTVLCLSEANYKSFKEQFSEYVLSPKTPFKECQTLRFLTVLYSHPSGELRGVAKEIIDELSVEDQKLFHQMSFDLIREDILDSCQKKLWMNTKKINQLFLDRVITEEMYFKLLKQLKMDVLGIDKEGAQPDQCKTSQGLNIQEREKNSGQYLSKRIRDRQPNSSALIDMSSSKRARHCSGGAPDKETLFEICGENTLAALRGINFDNREASPFTQYVINNASVSDPTESELRDFLSDLLSGDSDKCSKLMSAACALNIISVEKFKERFPFPKELIELMIPELIDRIGKLPDESAVRFFSSLNGSAQPVFAFQGGESDIELMQKILIGTFQQLDSLEMKDAFLKMAAADPEVATNWCMSFDPQIWLRWLLDRPAESLALWLSIAGQVNSQWQANVKAILDEANCNIDSYESHQLQSSRRSAKKRDYQCLANRLSVLEAASFDTNFISDCIGREFLKGKSDYFENIGDGQSPEINHHLFVEGVVDVVAGVPQFLEPQDAPLSQDIQKILVPLIQYLQATEQLVFVDIIMNSLTDQDKATLKAVILEQQALSVSPSRKRRISDTDSGSEQKVKIIKVE